MLIRCVHKVSVDKVCQENTSIGCVDKGSIGCVSGVSGERVRGYISRVWP